MQIAKLTLKITCLLVCAVAAITYPGQNYIFLAQNTYAKEALANNMELKVIPKVKPQALPLKISAEAVYIAYMPTFTQVYAKNETQKLYPASTTKMLTAITAKKYLKTESIVNVKVATDEGQIMELKNNERLTVENLLYGALVQSANDAAYALAIATSGSLDKFMTLANEQAQKIGMYNSYFTNPAGLDEDGLHSTAQDLAKLAYNILKDPYLKKMVSTKSITILDEDFKYTHILNNVNELLGDVEGIGGVKTGQTELAGQNLVTYFKTPYSNHEFIIVILKSEDRFKDTREIANWLNFNIEYERL